MKTKVLLGVSVLVMAAWTAQAVEDGLGTNVVKNLRVVPDGTLSLGDVAITNWTLMPLGTGAVSLADYVVWTNAVQGATSALNSATVALDVAVGSLNSATTALNLATGSLNTAVANLNARTNAWNNGVVIKIGSVTTITKGNLYYMGNGSVWSNASALTNATAQGLIGLALETESPPYTNGLLLNGQFTKTSHGFTLGSILYMGTNDCVITNIVPFRTNHMVRIVGYAIDADTIMFNPDRTYIEILGE